MRELATRLEQLAQRWDLPEGARSRLARLLDVQAEDPHAPTTVTDPLEAVEVHVADSLSGLEVDGLRSASELVDIGSGAGFPGLVLAIALPEARVDLVESTRRKCAYLERTVVTLALENARVICRRAEQWAQGEGRQGYSGATARAVDSLATLVEYAAPLLREGGVLVAWKGSRDADEERRAAEAATLVGMRPAGVEVVRPFAGSRSRHLYTYEQIAACPPAYPRRPGMARKRPLGTDRV
jgi:16S rRNA (guanine527-N7)-methyltransferase